jgi:hypothetical protein
VAEQRTFNSWAEGSIPSRSNGLIADRKIMNTSKTLFYGKAAAYAGVGSTPTQPIGANMMLIVVAFIIIFGIAFFSNKDDNDKI